MLREPSRSWAYVRAGLISLVLASQCVSAIPDQPLRAKMLQRPEGQRVVGFIARVFDALGADPDPRRIERGLLAASARVRQVRNALLAPLKPIERATAMRQQWSLFSVSSPFAFRLRLEAQRAAGDWQLIYRANGEDVLGLGPWLRYRRLRGLYSPSGSSGTRQQYPALVDWLASRILRDHPEYSALRASMERLSLATREQPNQSLGLEDVFERQRSVQR
ncbi:MAG TPA: hypothetical protein VJV78_44105 [Polyangiales bacterium]|nr:hypothetical protein [Polyangiales bacterium]